MAIDVETLWWRDVGVTEFQITGNSTICTKDCSLWQQGTIRIFGPLWGNPSSTLLRSGLHLNKQILVMFSNLLFPGWWCIKHLGPYTITHSAFVESSLRNIHVWLIEAEISCWRRSLTVVWHIIGVYIMVLGNLVNNIEMLIQLWEYLPCRPRK